MAGGQDSGPQIPSAVVLVKDAKAFRPALSFLNRQGIRAMTASSLDDALDYLNKRHVNLVLLSVEYGHQKVEALPELFRLKFGVPTMVFSERGDRLAVPRMEAMKARVVVAGSASGPILLSRIRMIEKDLPRLGVPNEVPQPSQSAATNASGDGRLGGRKASIYDTANHGTKGDASTSLSVASPVAMNEEPGLLDEFSFDPELEAMAIPARNSVPTSMPPASVSASLPTSTPTPTAAPTSAPSSKSEWRIPEDPVHAIIYKAMRETLARLCQLPDPAVKFPSDYRHVAIIAIRTAQLKAAIIMTVGYSRRHTTAVIHEMESEMLERLRKLGLQLPGGGYTIVQLESVRTMSDVYSAADFTMVAKNKETEISMAFVDGANAFPDLAVQADQMCKVPINCFHQNVPLKFDVFIHLPVNKKYLLYVRNGSSLSELQAQKLNDRRVTHLYLRKSESEAYRAFFAQQSLLQVLRVPDAPTRSG